LSLTDGFDVTPVEGKKDGCEADDRELRTALPKMLDLTRATDI
jgi:hypothetical protein